MDKKPIYYLTPALLAVLMFSSNFLSTDLFKAGFQNFSVWFVLSVFSFACGWLINKTLGWNFGGKVLFAVIVATAIFSNMLVLFFREYFGLNELLSENLILYSLRNITLGAIAFFGMAVAEVLMLQKEIFSHKQKSAIYEKVLKDPEKVAENILEDARLKADRILFDAEKKFKEVVDKKNRIEIQLKEFIQAEKELIQKYEADKE
ncbi:MAG: hypothetical protein A2V66_13995 [Ignavibacteria bacterium RBG_13_36_8]|nr:MAG: hypothetical protein A2V66_13995 [Ignavibacteria bacterium RBG_13_36_8]